MPDFPRLFTIPEAASRFGLSEAELRRKIDAGKIQAMRFNGDVVVSEKQLRKKTGTPYINCG